MLGNFGCLFSGFLFLILFQNMPFIAVSYLLLLFFVDLCSCNEYFWLTADLVNVQWRKGCLTTGGCGDPRFKLTETNWASNEQVSISWSILEDFNQVITATLTVQVLTAFCGFKLFNGN